MSKYTPLRERLRRCGQDELTLTLTEIEAALGDPLPPSARTRRGWWSNRRHGSPQATAWMAAGYHVAHLDLEAGRVTFRKPPRAYRVQRVEGVVMWTGALVKALRLHAGWTQAQLAAEMGVRQQTVSEWETGVYVPGRAMSKYLSLVAERAGFQYGEEE
jgi:DNA-binding transcriptional regulator YiaG